MIHLLSFTLAELRGTEVRVPVRAGNSWAQPGSFEAVDLSGARTRRVGGITEIRARAKFRAGTRVVSVIPRYIPGDELRVKVPSRRTRVVFRVLDVQGRLVRDTALPSQIFDAEAWVARHGRAAYFDRNVWTWAIVLKREAR